MKKKKKAEEEHLRAEEEFGGSLAARAPQSLVATIQTATATKAGEAAMQAIDDAKISEENVEQHLKGDSSLNGLPPMDANQTKLMAKSISTLVEQQMKQMVKYWEERFVAQQPKAKEEDEDSSDEELQAAEEGDGGIPFTKKMSQGQRKKWRKQRKEAMIDDSSERKPAEKRPADEDDTAAAEREKEQAAGVADGSTEANGNGSAAKPKTLAIMAD